MLSYSHTMSLALDTSRQLRSVGELAQLVEAISRAPASESEPDWLEWKSDADLTDKHWHAVIAKLVAGFANRDPASARREAGGCGYIVVGAEPGNVPGVTPVDHADLSSGVSRFVGPAVRWDPRYIECRGRQVLVVTVEPPEFGHPIRAILRAHQPGSGFRMRQGDVYVRSHGRTDLATQADYDMLNRRYAASREQITDIRVDSMGTVSAVPVECGPERIRTLCFHIRESLDVPHLPLALRNFRPALENRTVSEYKDELDSYIDELAPVLIHVAHAEALAGLEPGMELRLSNESQHNFDAVRVKIEFEQEVFAYPGVEEVVPPIPNPPRKWGSMNRLDGLDSLTGSGMMPDLLGLPEIDNSGPTTVKFDDVDLRPSDTIKLDPIHLVTTADLAGTVLSAKWTATSSSADRVANGELLVEVSPDTITSHDSVIARLAVG